MMISFQGSNGIIEKELRFLDQGIIREYYATNNKEKNINFYTNSGFITDFSSFTNTSETKKYQECLSPNFTLIFIHYIYFIYSKISTFNQNHIPTP